MALRFLAPLLLVFSSACEYSLADQVITTKRQSFDASHITRARLETGAGQLRITGRKGATAIEVVADYRGPGSMTSEKIMENIKLRMETTDNTFFLKTERRDKLDWFDGGGIDLTITLPSQLQLEVNDGAGSMRVVGMDSDVDITDGSGSMEVEDIGGNLTIHDGSGSITVRGVGKNLEITDGSGGMEITHVKGNVRIEDGSGSIHVEDVGGSLEVPRHGSGSIHHRDVRGEVRVPTRKHHSNW